MIYSAMTEPGSFPSEEVRTDAGRCHGVRGAALDMMGRGWFTLSCDGWVNEGGVVTKGRRCRLYLLPRSRRGWASVHLHLLDVI